MDQGFEEEDEVIYDKTSLLQRAQAAPRRPSPATETRRAHLLRLASIVLLFICLGISLAIPGPTLRCFEYLTHSEEHLVSCLFVGRAGGILVASLLTQLLLDFMPADCLSVMGLLLLSVAHFFIPWSERIWWLVGAFAFQGAAIGLVLSGGLALTRLLYGARHLTFRHFFLVAMAFGCLLTPFLVMPFQADDLTAPSLVVNRTSTPAPIRLPRHAVLHARSIKRGGVGQPPPTHGLNDGKFGDTGALDDSLTSSTLPPIPSKSEAELVSNPSSSISGNYSSSPTRHFNLSKNMTKSSFGSSPKVTSQVATPTKLTVAVSSSKDSSLLPASSKSSTTSSSSTVSPQFSSSSKTTSPTQSTATQRSLTSNNRLSAAENASASNERPSAAERAPVSKNRSSAAENASASNERSSAAENASASNERPSAAERAPVSKNRPSAAENASASNERPSAAENASASNERPSAAEKAPVSNERPSAAENASASKGRPSVAENASESEEQPSAVESNSASNNRSSAAKSSSSSTASPNATSPTLLSATQRTSVSNGLPSSAPSSTASVGLTRNFSTLSNRSSTSGGASVSNNRPSAAQNASKSDSQSSAASIDRSTSTPTPSPELTSTPSMRAPRRKGGLIIPTTRRRPSLKERYHHLVGRISTLRPVQRIYLSLGALCLFVCLVSLHLCCACRRVPRFPVTSESPTLFGHHQFTLSDLAFLAAFLLLSCIVAGLEVTLGNYLYAWARQEVPAWTSIASLLLTSAFWVGLLIGRLSLVMLSKTGWKLMRLSVFLSLHLILLLSAGFLLVWLGWRRTALGVGVALAGWGLGPIRFLLAMWLESGGMRGAELRWMNTLSSVAAGAGEAILPVIAAFVHQVGKQRHALWMTTVSCGAAALTMFAVAAALMKWRVVGQRVNNDDEDEELLATAAGGDSDDPEDGTFALRKLRNNGAAKQQRGGTVRHQRLLDLEDDELDLH